MPAAELSSATQKVVPTPISSDGYKAESDADIFDALFSNWGGDVDLAEVSKASNKELGQSKAAAFSWHSGCLQQLWKRDIRSCNQTMDLQCSVHQPSQIRDE